jgi:hypothetical protein
VLPDPMSAECIDFCLTVFDADGDDDHDLRDSARFLNRYQGD